MGKVFSRYLSTGSDSLVQSNLARSPRVVTVDKASDQGRHGAADRGCEATPHKADAPGNGTPSPTQPPHEGTQTTKATQEVDVVGIPTTNQESSAAQKDSYALPVKAVPSNDASLKHLRNSDQKLPLPSSRFRWPLAVPGQLFGIPLRSGAGGGARYVDQRQLCQGSASEAASLPSSVPLCNYSETNADSLATRLRPVYKRDKRAQHGRTWWPPQTAFMTLVGLALSVALFLVVITTLLKRSRLNGLSAGLLSTHTTSAMAQSTVSKDDAVVSAKKDTTERRHRFAID
ncbi:hypothetical protein MTO96_015443 [Rhipicephalus appendiculatus]